MAFSGFDSGVWVGVLVARCWCVAGAAGWPVRVFGAVMPKREVSIESTSSFCCTVPSPTHAFFKQQQVPLQLPPPPCVFLTLTLCFILLQERLCLFFVQSILDVSQCRLNYLLIFNAFSTPVVLHSRRVALHVACLSQRLDPATTTTTTTLYLSNGLDTLALHCSGLSTPEHAE